MPIFTRVTDCTFAGRAVSLARRVELWEKAEPVLDGPDDAAWATLAAAGRRHLSAAVLADDAAAALAQFAVGETGTLAFSAAGPGAGGGVLDVSVANAVLLEVAPAVPGQPAGGALLRFAAASADGSASPLSVA